jgi:hypothetical protein
MLASVTYPAGLPQPSSTVLDPCWIFRLESAFPQVTALGGRFRFNV